MLSLIKNSAVVILGLTLAQCNQVSVSNESNSFHINPKDTVQKTAPTFTILTAGMPPPFLYQNAEKMIAREYNIRFISVAGCIISERLSDSIKKFNENSFTLLKTHYKRDIIKEIYPRIDKEAAHLVKLDSILAKKKDLKRMTLTENAYKSYDKKGSLYYIYYVTNEQNKNVTEKEPRYWLNKLRLVVSCDSLGKTLYNISPKDSLVNSIYDF